MDHKLNSIHILLQSVPIHLGFSPPAWQTMTDVEILKGIQQTHVDKFRTIQLMDPEFQINNNNNNILFILPETGDYSPVRMGARRGPDPGVARNEKKKEIFLGKFFTGHLFHRVLMWSCFAC